METGLVSPSFLTTAVGTDNDSAKVGYGVNLSQDAAAFAESLERVAAPEAIQEPSAVTEALFAPLDFINNEAKELAAYAQNAIESDNELTPSEIVTLTTRSQEFMFYSQLTSNVANRTADGLQQLFRQQG
ncbi:hypothetical protein [Granulosicoccus antarcticus]|uniref:Uncharacterized protein n=1 Tax=Granulosicoccus antarcticus IMCC3135 TaxID=1192854 RepID=A0A2Z2NKG4_9GAMM|nr:hypothetical protein [Granulosicoccus antarcticus]ASJ70501.1 hypothetical protein IMCC3135_01935 [Granulosicoccus antarcticus IMCC3135]